MLLKMFEDKKIPNEINVFFDDLANQYIKSNYEYGIGIDTDVIGRYKFNKIYISIIDQQIDPNFLIYTKEGYLEQDRLILYYFKYILFKELKEIISLYNDTDFDVSNIEITDGKNILGRDKLKNKIIKITVSGIFIASYIFGIDKVKKLLDKQSNYIDNNNICISEYIDNKNYDLSYITGVIKEKKVIPNVEKSKIDYGKDFVGQKADEPLLKQLNKLAKENELIKNLLKKIQGESTNNTEKKEKNENNIQLEKILKEFRQSIEEIRGISNNNQRAIIVDSDEKTEKILNEKFENEYEDKEYVKYFEDTTKSKVNEKDKPILNEVMKANKKESVSQKGFDKFRNIKTLFVDTIDYLYNICASEVDPLEKLEKSLSLLSCKYENVSKKDIVYNTAKNIISTKIKNLIINKVNNFANINLPDEKIDIYLKNGIKDVDDIPINIKRVNGKEYKFLMLFKNRNLVKRSYQDIDGKRKYKRARRLLDNILIEIIVKVFGLKNKNFDGVEDDRQNILRNLLLFIDNNVNGMDIEFMRRIKDMKNITNAFVSIIKSKYNFRDDSLKFISDMMINKVYSNYADKSQKSKDKNLILSLFAKEQAFKYNMRMRGCYSIYIFYKEFFNSDNNENHIYFVCNNAKIMCSNCPSVTNLIVDQSDKYIENKACADVESKNIKPFEFCSVAQVCTPQLTNWSETKDVLVNGKKALLSNSMCSCKVGGILKIVDANQKISKLKNIEDSDNKLEYELDDYKNVELIYDITNQYRKGLFAESKLNNEIEKKTFRIIIRKILKAKYDNKKLENDTSIIAVDNSIKALINVYTLCDIIIDKKIKDFREAIKYMPVVYSPYESTRIENSNPYWMEKIYNEMNNTKTDKKLEDAIKKYHLLGANIRADKNTAWCASFASYILDIGIKTARSLDFLGTKLLKKLEKPKYGAIMIIKNNEHSGHITFFVEEKENGYLCIGGNQSGVIKPSIFKKTNKIQGFFWPV